MEVLELKGPFAAVSDREQLLLSVQTVSGERRDAVRRRLEAAARIIEQTGGRVLPKGAGSAWPTIARTMEEVRELEAEMAEEDKPKLRRVPSTLEVSQAEEALFWTLYVEEARAKAALNIWMRCRALRIKSWQREALRHGFSKSGATRSQQRAFAWIAVGLNLDGKDLADD